MTTFKQQNLDLIEAVGAWTVPTFLRLKRWDDSKSDYEHGILKWNEQISQYEWWYRGFADISRTDWGPFVEVNKPYIEELIDDGWMVNE